MRSSAVWYEVFDVGDRASVLTCLARLRPHGIELEPHVGQARGGSTVIFFERVSPGLRDAIEQASGGGADRVLAVALAGTIGEDDAWALLDAGASDVLAWDGSPRAASEIVARLARWDEVDRLIDSPLVRDNLIGGARAWRTLLRQVVEVARFTDASILVLGETGTGKELIARLIHALDARPQKRDLVVLDCTTIVPELAGSELFGHERGAYTGAEGSRLGAFALADGGTLFLDEIGDLPLPMQAQLLRAIQERSFKPVGGNTWRSTRFRLVCATHRRLSDEVGTGMFRADLYYRLGAVVCAVPPLRERPEDILVLFRHFVAQFTGRSEPPEMADAVRQLLLRRPYPGNVRELQQLARRAACRHVGDGPISVGDIPEEERPRADARATDESSLELAIRHELARGAGLKAISRAAAAAAIRVALGEANGNLQLAARRLGVTDRALQMRRASAPGPSRTRRSA